MVSDNNGKKVKERIYNAVAHMGIWAMFKFFPEYFATEPLRPNDRYYEYPWAIGQLPKEKCQILDVGCSGSMFPLLIQAMGHDVIGLDIRNYSPIDRLFFIRGDAREMTFSDERFDIVTAISSVEHIGLGGRYGATSDIEGDIKAVNEIYRVLRKGGIFVMSVPYDWKCRVDITNKVYDDEKLDIMLKKFQWTKELINSPEGNYKIALVRGVK